MNMRARPFPWAKITVAVLALTMALVPMWATLAGTTTIKPVADAYLSQSYPTANYGTSTSLRTDASPIIRSFLRFNVTGLQTSVTKATLRIYANSGNSTGYTVLAQSNNAWNETSITYANQPALGSALGKSASYAAGTWTSVDVTSFVRGNGTYSLELTTTSTTNTNFASRESANAPELVVETANGASSTPTPSESPSASPSPSPTAPPADVQPSFPIRAAFYYPWFPESWKQLGIYPYTNYHPTLGFYDGSSATVLASHIASMQYAGLQAGIASWWGQGTSTDSRIPQLLKAAAGTPFRWSLYYEAESLGDPTVGQINSDLTYIRDHYGNDPSFLRVGGKFVVFVYADGTDLCGMADRWKQANTVGAYVVLKVFPGYKSCASQPQGWHQYAPAVAEDNQAPYSYTVSPGFYKYGEAVRLPRSLPTFTQSVKNMVASKAQFQLVTTFNEWGEGTSVESATEWATTGGHGTYLDALHGVLGSVGPSPSPSPSPSTSPTPSGSPTPSASPTPSVSPTPSSTPSGSVCGNLPTGNTINTVVVIAEENRSWSSVGGVGFSGSQMPYLHNLGSQCAIFQNDSEINTSENSLTQYIGAWTGLNDPNGIGNDCSPSSSCSTTANNIFRVFRDAGIAHKEYVEGATTGCSAGGNAAKHVPDLYMWDSTDKANCANEVRPLTEFNWASPPPGFAFITPNLCNDGHDCGNSTVDSWLANSGRLPALFNSAQYKAGKVLVEMWWDEDQPRPNLFACWSCLHLSSPLDPHYYGESRLWLNLLGAPTTNLGGISSSTLDLRPVLGLL
jgi:glycosyl hydrolase family 99